MNIFTKYLKHYALKGAEKRVQKKGGRKKRGGGRVEVSFQTSSISVSFKKATHI